MMFSFLFLSYTLSAQEKCMCNLVKGYTSDAYKVYEGEVKNTVPSGQELWIKMYPAHSRNRGENGGCRLQAGEIYVTDLNGKPIRAYSCGNSILEYEFYSTNSNTTITTASLPGEINVTVNVNTGNDKDLQRNFDFQNESQKIGGLDGRYLLVSDQQARSNFDYNALQNNPEVKRTWFGKNWWWVVPVGLVAGYIVADGLSDGQWFEWFDHPFTKTRYVKIYLPGDPNNPDHNPNNRNFNGGSFSERLNNIALDASAQFSTGPSRGFVIPLGH